MQAEIPASLSILNDTQNLYTDLTSIITEITGAFDGKAEHAVGILLKISHSIRLVFNNLMQIIGWLSKDLYDEIQKIYGAINDIEIALLQIIQSLRLAASSFYQHTIEYLELDATIGMAIQDQASALSSMIEIIADITNLNGAAKLTESLGLIGLLQTIISISHNILGFSSKILVTINAQVSPLQTNMINILTDANAEISEVLEESNNTDAAFSTILSTTLNGVDVDLISIWSDKSVQMLDTLDDVVDVLASTANNLTTSLTNVGVTVDPQLFDSINAFQMEVISLTDALGDISQMLEWIPNSVTVAAINVITSVDAMIASLNDLLSGPANENVANTIEAQLSSIADMLNTLIAAVSRQIDNAFSSVLFSKNLLEDLQNLAPIANSLAFKLQDVVADSFVVLERALSSVVSVEKFTWTPADATALTDILNVLQLITGRITNTDVDISQYPSIVAMLDTSHNGVVAVNMVDYTVKSILSLFA